VLLVCRRIEGLLTLSGKKAGKLAVAGSYIKKIAQNDNLSPKELLDYVCNFLEGSGMAKIESYDVQNDKIVIKAKKSIFAQGIENKKPVCMPLAGALSVVFEKVLGNEWECKEVECQAQKKESCIFKLKRKK
jgi:predicted hydrocarbon binding protein